MTKFKLFLLKNRMLIANSVANFIGVTANFFLIRNADVPIPQDISVISRHINSVFMPLSFLFGFLFVFIYELPVRKYLNCQYRNILVSNAFFTKVRRRLLNEPFVLIAMDFGIWLTAAFVYTAGFMRANAPGEILQLAFLGSLATGLITITAAFFAFEFIMQRLHAPYFFPDGGLYSTTKTFKIKIRTRLIALLCACNLIPFFYIFHVLRRIFRANLDPTIALERLYSAIITQSLVFVGVAIWLTFLVSSNLVRPIREIIQVLRAVQKGHFNQKVRVTSNDEIGYTGDVINEMTEGLKERERMRHSLDLAMEVQRNLLPKDDPNFEGLDIAGKSIYCDETGGDYYDFFEFGEYRTGRIGIVLGDVSGHGISSALLMATARAFLRQRSALPGTISQVISDINRQLARDVVDSGSFMSMFYMIIDKTNKSLKWVRAGHDPAIFYDPNTDKFSGLKGAGMALGVDENWQYGENEKQNLANGQIIVLGTDGIWEARNPKGEMFGKEPIYTIIRENANLSAKSILNTIVESLTNFQDNSNVEDDVTLVVIKILSKF